MKKILTSNRGSVLLESVVALAVIIIVTAAISTVVSISVSNSTFTRSQNQANKYAQEGMEYMRALTEADYAYFADDLVPDSDGTENKFCFNGDFQLRGEAEDDCKGGPSSNPDIILEQGFERQILIRQDCSITTTSDPYDAEVTVVVRWSSGRCSATNTFCHEARFVSCINSPGDRQL